jgi:hypothetical protein
MITVDELYRQYLKIRDETYHCETEEVRKVMKEALLGMLYGNPNIVPPKDYAQEYLKSSKQTLFKGED